MIFIGPSPDAVTAMGDKTAARALAQKINVPGGAKAKKPASSRAAIRLGLFIVGRPS